MSGWIMGEPTKAGWYICAVRTNDPTEQYYVLQLWFNPDATPKYWTGGGYVSDTAQKYWGQDRIRAYQNLPLPPDMHLQDAAQEFY